MGISWARMLEYVAIPFFRGSCRRRDPTRVFCTGRWWILYHMGSPLIALTNRLISGVQQRKFISHSVQGRGSWYDGSPGVFLVSSDSGWRRQWRPTLVLLPGKCHGRSSLIGCSPWGRWELDATQWLHFHFSLSCIGEGNGKPLQCSCLENHRDGGAWWAAVYGVTQSRTQLKQLCSSRINFTTNTLNNYSFYLVIIDVCSFLKHALVF